MTAIQNQIKEWRAGLLSPNKNDVLLNLQPDKNAFAIDIVYQEDKTFSLKENAFLKKIYKQHRDSIKESGSPIFGIAKGRIAFELEQQNYAMPFLLADASIARNRFNGLYEIQQTEDFYINPLLLKTLKLKEISSDFETATQNLEELGLKVQLEERVWIANFHPHRFVLQKEFDAILEAPQINESLKSLFGKAVKKNEIQFAEHYLFPADVSQRAAIEKVQNNNLVIQGPPGTGKSQVIANLIGKTLGKNKSALLVAEKSVALQVIYDQMKRKNLHHFCVLYHHELKAKHFVRSLENTWKHLETMERSSVVVGQQADLLSQGLDLTLARLRQTDLIGGVSFSEFQTLGEIEEESTYFSKKPSIPVWQKEQVILEKLKQNNFPIFGSWLNFNTSRFSGKEIEQTVKNISENINQLHDKELTFQQLQEKVKQGHLLRLFYHDDQALPLKVFKKDSRLQKRFLKLFNEYKTLLEKETVLKSEEKLWDKRFSLTELQEYIATLSSTNRFNIKSWMTKQKLAKFTHLSLSDTKKALENLVELHQVKKALIETKANLRKSKLTDELPILEHIQFAINKINSTDQNEIKLLFELTEKERQTLKEETPHLIEIYQNWQRYFNGFAMESTNVSVSTAIEQIKTEIPLMVENSVLIQEVSPSTKAILQHTKSLEKTHKAILNAHWKDFKGQFPRLAEISGTQLQQKLEEIIHSFDKESEEFSSFIAQSIKTQFESYHQLLQTPARKLNEEQKALKKRLRKGKSILVKAFDKKRIFPSVRELLESEAQVWIQLLHPVFLCSPYSVAKSLPIDHHFDLGVFDEASQIPLSHIIGAVQRSQRIVISGDQQQMAPQFYFQKKTLHQSDALHHASFYWENVLLTHHYRSQHPSLIAFSNQCFYDNQLKTFPTPRPQNPIELITTDGVFEERINEKEAELVARILSDKIKNKAFDFGLVAFSQTQLNAILERIPSTYLEELADKDSLFVQSLENVQGDQCEHLIISLGYAKNENGDFHKRFGPLNQEQGHRRLNVLMSRAISKITFVRSVTSSDFSISDNEGVESLRKLMLFLEKEENTAVENHFPTGIEQEDGVLKIRDIAYTFETAQEVVDFYRTSAVRGWKIKVL